MNGARAGLPWEDGGTGSCCGVGGVWEGSVGGAREGSVGGTREGSVGGTREGSVGVTREGSVVGTLEGSVGGGCKREVYSISGGNRWQWMRSLEEW